MAGDCHILRPGRFMRGTADNYNLEGTGVYVDVVKFNGSKESPKMTFVRESVPVSPAIETFSTAARNKDNTKDFYEMLTAQVNSLLDKMETKEVKENSVYDVLDGMESLDPRVKERVEEYLKVQGVFRTTVEI